jgi:indolepyruvate ferredoxin oxidoreductase alpha subunit
MGASIGMAHGAELALGREFAGFSVAVIGDSTFFHSGMTGLASAAYNGSNITVLILDNGITGMTGHQDNPSTGKTLCGKETVKLGIEDICRALGASAVTVVDPVDQKALTKALRDAWASDGVKVVIARRPCALLVKADGVLSIDQSLCIGCKLCMQTGCPALRFTDGKASIDASMCRGCGLCREVCPSDCIGMGG